MLEDDGNHNASLAASLAHLVGDLMELQEVLLAGEEAGKGGRGWKRALAWETERFLNGAAVGIKEIKYSFSKYFL